MYFIHGCIVLIQVATRTMRWRWLPMPWSSEVRSGAALPASRSARQD